LVKEASKRLEVIPATYKAVSEQFMVTPSDRSLSVDNNIQFKPVTERIMIRPSYVTYQIIPAQFNNVSERIMLREAAPSAKVPKFKTETERILVKAASKRYEAILATYKTVTETVVFKEPIKTLSTTAPIYETVTERVIIWDSYTRYEKGKVDPTFLSANPDDCRVLCLVEIPGEYKTITKTVLKTPARITKSVSPA
jgi:hypothetical protein